MSKNKFHTNKAEHKMISELHQKNLLEKYRPIIDMISKYDSPDAMIKKSLPMSVLGLIVSQFSENEGIALKARTEIINRGLGKPVERTVNIYGDIAQMNEKDMDNQILQLFNKTDANRLIEGSQPKIKQKRKPRKSEPLVYEARVSEERTQAPQPATEAGPSSDSQN
jgi:hypothetical protein